MLGNQVLVYLDDLLIFAATVKRLLEKIVQVFSLLINANLICNALKCLLFAKTILYFRHVVGNAKIEPKKTRLDYI